MMMKLIPLLLAVSLSALASPTKSLFGIYQREQITDSENFEYRVLGQLDNHCSATLIGRRHVLTAAHCIYNSTKKEWSNELNFNPGRVKANQAPHGRYLWKKVFLPKEFLPLKPGDQEYSKFDYAVIELEKDVGNEMGWYGIRAIEPNETTTQLKITGYPLDKLLGTMWTVNCPAEIDEQVIYHKCDSYPGMSGSALVSMRPEDTIPYVIGVLSVSSQTSNIGTAITEESLKQILSWVKGSKPANNTTTRDRPTPKFTKLFVMNNCQQKVRVAMKWRDYKNKDKLTTFGFWEIGPGYEGHLADTRHSSFYIWAQTSDKKITLEGDHQANVRGNTLPMRAMTIKNMKIGEYTVKITCRE